jgi:hypothetical protein
VPAWSRARGWRGGAASTRAGSGRVHRAVCPGSSGAFLGLPTSNFAPCFYSFNAQAHKPPWSMSLPRWSPCFPLVLYPLPSLAVSSRVACRGGKRPGALHSTHCGCILSSAPLPSSLLSVNFVCASVSLFEK